ncbi:hypothetical protein [Streptomyces niveus]|uniref:hypothetical protein n=1 Tax=Streptomyces niveus TaxID=193462 RepID=UPI00343A50E0
MSEPTPGAPTRESAEQLTCKFLGCGDARETKKDQSAPGPASDYCARPDHTAGAAWRARKKAERAAAAKTGAPEEPETDKPVTDSAADAVNVREDVVRLLKQLPESLDRYVGLLETITDPEAAEAQVLAVESEANTRVATALARADGERTRRITAEQAKDAAEGEKDAANEAAEQMETELAEARARFQAEVERITAAAANDVQEARDLQERKRQEAELLVAEANEKTTTHVNAARKAAADEIAAMRKRSEAEIKDAHHVAGLAKNDADRRIAEMTTTLENAQAAAATQVEEANGKATTAEARANEAEENGRQALRNAEGMVQAAKDAAETVQDGLRAELERTNDKLEKRETRIDELRGELDKVKDKLRAVEDRARTAETALRAREEQEQTDTE